MERAGAAVAREVMQRFPDARRIAVVCGGGSNGGDGRIAARILREEGRDAVETTAVEQADVIVDALFGTGFHGEPREEAAATIERVNAAGAPVVSVDVPSGVDASTGEVGGAAVRATLTVTFHGRKLGLAIAPGLFHAGEVVVADIGLEPAETEHRLVTPAILSLVPRKRAEDSKYSAGAVLVAGGAPGMTGAACLAAEAAFRADAGYVAVAVPGTIASGRRGQAARAREADLGGCRRRRCEGRRARDRARSRPRCRREGAAADELLAAGEQKLVLDADALHELEPGDWGARAVLTPHAGELGRLLGESSGWVDAHRLEAARRCCRAVRLRLPAQGRRHDRRRARSGRPRRARRGAGARHGGHRRRPDRDPRRVPRQGPRPAPRAQRPRRPRTASPRGSCHSAASSRATSSRRCPPCSPSPAELPRSGDGPSLETAETYRGMRDPSSDLELTT